MYGLGTKRFELTSFRKRFTKIITSTRKVCNKEKPKIRLLQSVRTTPYILYIIV